MVFLLEGGGEVCGHLSDSVTGGVSNPGVLQGVGMRLGLASVLVKTSEMKCCDFSYRILTEEQNKADDLAQNGLHLLVTALADSRERHQTGVPVLPIG